MLRWGMWRKEPGQPVEDEKQPREGERQGDLAAACGHLAALYFVCAAPYAAGSAVCLPLVLSMCQPCSQTHLGEHPGAWGKLPLF